MNSTITHLGAAALWSFLAWSPGALAASDRDVLPPVPIASVPKTSSWMPTPADARGTVVLVGREAAGNLPRARVVISTEWRLDQDEALARIAAIARSRPGKPEAFAVEGWPAIQVTFEEPYPEIDGETKGEGIARSLLALRITIAIAVHDRVVRLEGSVARDETRARTRLDELSRLARGLRFRKPADPHLAPQLLQHLLDLISTVPPKRTPIDRHLDERVEILRTTPLVVNNTGRGELEVAASGPNAGIFTNDGLFTSTGAAFVQGVVPVNPAGTALVAPFPMPNAIKQAVGDPSIVVGQSGAFYASEIVRPFTTSGSTAGCSIGVSRSATFPNFALAVDAKSCPQTAMSTCFPDQPLLAADRRNATTSGDDQVYVVWRHFTRSTTCLGTMSGPETPRISCSSDSGATWIGEQDVSPSGDHARVTVGSDGSVYVLYRDGAALMVQRYNSCSSGLQPAQGFPVQVAAHTALACPIPGVDRCSAASDDSYSIGTDLDSAASIAVVQSEPDGSSDHIQLYVSQSYGRAWSGPVRINEPSAGRRFLPALCVGQGAAMIGWYDRRAATAANNDLTDYYLGFMPLSGVSLGAPVTEVNLSSAPDAQCAAGWNAPPAAASDATSCSVQPQNAGQCAGMPATRCDFAAPGVCPSGSCVPDRGDPKFGDYNGIACDAGQVVAAWATATAPLGVAPFAGAPSIRIVAARLQPPTVALSWEALPASSLPRSVRVFIDDAEYLGVADGHATGPIALSPGAHSFTLTGIWGPTNMSTTFGGACDTDGAFKLSPGQHLTCSATTMLSHKGICTVACSMQHDRCLEWRGPIPTSANPDAGEEHRHQCNLTFAQCLQSCGD